MRTKAPLPWSMPIIVRRRTIIGIDQNMAPNPTATKTRPGSQTEGWWSHWLWRFRCQSSPRLPGHWPRCRAQANGFGCLPPMLGTSQSGLVGKPFQARRRRPRRTRSPDLRQGEPALNTTAIRTATRTPRRGVVAFQVLARHIHLHREAGRATGNLPTYATIFADTRRAGAGEATGSCQPLPPPRYAGRWHD